MRAGGILQVMAFVEDEPRVRRQHRGVVPVLRDAPDGNVRKQQVMVHHDDVGLRRLAPRREQETLVEEVALEPQAEIRFRRNFVPQLLSGLHRQVAQRPVSRLPRPLDQLGQPVLGLAREQRGVRVRRLVQPVQAEVIAPSLEERIPHGLVVERPGKEWEVLPHQLFLQVDRVGGDHRPLAVPGRPAERRDQVA